MKRHLTADLGRGGREASSCEDKNASTKARASIGSLIAKFAVMLDVAMFLSFLSVRSSAPERRILYHISVQPCWMKRTHPPYLSVRRAWLTGNAAILAAEWWGEPSSASRPPLPMVGADHRTARSCGKTGQTGFATTHAVGPFDVWFCFDRISF